MEGKNAEYIRWGLVKILGTTQGISRREEFNTGNEMLVSYWLAEEAKARRVTTNSQVHH